jgi:hypothetical protein
MLVHARLPDMYLYHALLHAILHISHFRVFGCPCIAKKWTISLDGKPENNSKSTQRIDLRFSLTQKGLLLYAPSTRQIVISGDVICDEPLHPLWLRLGEHFMMLYHLDPPPHLILTHTLCRNVL